MIRATKKRKSNKKKKEQKKKWKNVRNNRSFAEVKMVEVMLR